MVNTCCAPNCKGNYKTGPKVSLFRFPKDDQLIQQWVNSIKREKGFTPTDTHRVCELHFKPDDVIREEVLFDRKKNISYVNKLSRPVLKEGAIPSILPNRPKYLINSRKTRESVYERLSKREAKQLDGARAESSNTKHDYETNISFSNLEEFKDNVKRNENVFNEDGNWSMRYCEKEVIIMNFEVNPIPKIRCSAVVNKDCMIRIFNDVTELEKVGSIDFPVKVCNILRLDRILKELLLACTEKSPLKVETDLCMDIALDNLEIRVAEDADHNYCMPKKRVRRMDFHK